MNADKIIVLDHGEVVEEGTHADLLRSNGRYASLVKAQGLGTSAKGMEPTLRGSEQSLKGPDRSTDIEATPLKLEISTLCEPDEQNVRATPHSVLTVFWTFLLENSHLWPQYMICLIVSVIGGKYHSRIPTVDPVY